MRNQASEAHANDRLLEEPEAMLVINVVRTLLHYFNARLRLRAGHQVESFGLSRD